MREILFRGKRTDNGEWVFGMAWIFKEKTMICPWHKGMCKYDTGYYPVQVIPKTFGQCTGLTDKNGKKIFEGDIINIEYPDTIIHNAFVNYIGASFYGDNGFDLWELDTYVSLEVIGNIHDNPELLKGGAE